MCIILMLFSSPAGKDGSGDDQQRSTGRSGQRREPDGVRLSLFISNEEAKGGASASPAGNQSILSPGSASRIVSGVPVRSGSMYFSSVERYLRHRGRRSSRAYEEQVAAWHVRSGARQCVART